jgi:hypothetical protein
MYSVFDMLIRILENWYFGCTEFYALNENKCPGSDKVSSDW